MTDLQMLTQEEVAEMLHTHVSTITILREVGVLPAIKIGRSFLFSQATIREFQVDYKGLDVSNKVKAIESMKIVLQRQGEMANGCLQRG